MLQKMSIMLLSSAPKITYYMNVHYSQSYASQSCKFIAVLDHKTNFSALNIVLSLFNYLLFKSI